MVNLIYRSWITWKTNQIIPTWLGCEERQHVTLLPRKIRCLRLQSIATGCLILLNIEDFFIDLDAIADTLVSRNQVFTNMATTMIKSGSHKFSQLEWICRETLWWLVTHCYVEAIPMDLASNSHKVKCYCFQACACHYTGASGMPA